MQNDYELVCVGTGSPEVIGDVRSELQQGAVRYTVDRLAGTCAQIMRL
jgi:hypothetical protein